MRRSTTIAAALAALVGAGALAIPASMAGAVAPTTLYVSPTANTSINNNHHSCPTAGYKSVQAAVNAAPNGSKIEVCKGTYHASLSIPASKKNLQIIGATGSVLAPTTAPAASADILGGSPDIAIVRVAPGATGTSISGIEINGSGIEAAVNGCNDDLVGLLFSGTPGHAASGTAQSVDVTNTIPTNVGCGNGLGIDVESTGTATVTIHQDTVTKYGKNGITCSGLGAKCTINADTVTTASTAALAQNGIQVSFGATGAVTDNFITGNAWTAYSPPVSDPQPEPQSDFAAGVLLYGAGLNSSGTTTTSILVGNNTLKNNQVGVEVVDSESTVNQNSITETGSGLVDSIGVFGVGCDDYCMYFTDHTGGAMLNTVASTHQTIKLTNNTINFNASPTGSHGIWLGDNSWSAAPGYSAPAGHEDPTVAGSNSISHVATPLTIAGGA
jgi:hypothetical protein